MKVSTDWHGQVSQRRSGYPGAHLLGWLILAAMVLGVCGRVLDFPLNRDENLFVTVSVMGRFGNLYDRLGYNHLPYLPWLLGTVYRLTGTAYYLLCGRMVVLLGWLAMLVALLLIGRRRNAGFVAFFACAVLLMGNVLLLGQPGMLVSNNLVPVPAALFAVYFLLKGMGEEHPSRLACFAAGLCVSLAIGLKANYIFLGPVFAAATLLAPARRSLGVRLREQGLPLALGGLVAGLPVLVLMASAPEPFFAHTIRYFTEMQAAYWSHATEPKVASLSEKILLAEGVWASGATLLAITAIVALLTLAAMRGRARETMGIARTWPVVMTMCLAGCGAVVAFAPTPSFPQYFVPPIPFILVTLLLLRGATAPANAKTVDAVLAAIAIMGLACSASRTAPGFLELARPMRWHTVTVHRDMQALARAAGFKGGETAATITPVLALEGGFTVPPEFAAGPFVYRIADYLPARDRRWYTTTSPTSLDAFFQAHPPPAILVSGEEPLEQPFVRYAKTHGYREFAIVGKPEGARLFRRP